MTHRYIVQEMARSNGKYYNIRDGACATLEEAKQLIADHPAGFGPFRVIFKGRKVA